VGEDPLEVDMSGRGVRKSYVSWLVPEVRNGSMDSARYSGALRREY